MSWGGICLKLTGVLCCSFKVLESGYVHSCFSLESFSLCKKDLLLLCLRHCVYIGLSESRLDVRKEIMLLTSFQVMVLLVISLSDARLLVGKKRDIQRLRITPNLICLVSSSASFISHSSVTALLEMKSHMPTRIRFKCLFQTMSQNTISDLLLSLLLLWRRQIQLIAYKSLHTSSSANIVSGGASGALLENIKPRFFTLFNTVSCLKAVPRGFLA